MASEHATRSIRIHHRTGNQLLRFLLVNGLCGALLGLAFVGGVIALNLGHLRDLITFSQDGILALLLLSVGSIITFASVVMGGAVMLMDKDEGDRSTGKRVNVALVPVPVTVAVRKSR